MREPDPPEPPGREEDPPLLVPPEAAELFFGVPPEAFVDVVGFRPD